jgi:hypothetical protein
MTDDDLLRRAARNYCYEVGQLLAQTKLVVSLKLPEGDPVSNALVEAALLHARLLHEFFSHEKPRKDDVLPEHFYADGVTWTRRDILDADEIDDVNACLAHLALRRREDAEWPLGKFAQFVCDAHRDFVRLLPSDRVAWFATATEVVDAASPKTVPLSNTSPGQMIL